MSSIINSDNGEPGLPGAAGGSGVVIIRYPGGQKGTGGVVTSANDTIRPHSGISLHSNQNPVFSGYLIG